MSTYIHKSIHLHRWSQRGVHTAPVPGLDCFGEPARMAGSFGRPRRCDCTGLSLSLMAAVLTLSFPSVAGLVNIGEAPGMGSNFKQTVHSPGPCGTYVPEPLALSRSVGRREERMLSLRGGVPSQGSDQLGTVRFEGCVSWPATWSGVANSVKCLRYLRAQPSDMTSLNAGGGSSAPLWGEIRGERGRALRGFGVLGRAPGSAARLADPLPRALRATPPSALPPASKQRSQPGTGRASPLAGAATAL